MEKVSIPVRNKNHRKDFSKTKFIGHVDIPKEPSFMKLVAEKEKRNKIFKKETPGFGFVFVLLIVFLVFYLIFNKYIFS